jgi:hypothetical protein
MNTSSIHPVTYEVKSKVDKKHLAGLTCKPFFLWQGEELLQAKNLIPRHNIIKYEVVIQVSEYKRQVTKILYIIL